MYIYLAFSLPNFHSKKEIKKKKTEQKTLQMVKLLESPAPPLEMEHLLNSSAR